MAERRFPSVRTALLTALAPLALVAALLLGAPLLRGAGSVQAADAGNTIANFRFAAAAAPEAPLAL